MSDRYHDESAVSNRSTAADSPSLLLLSCQFRGAFSLSLSQTRTIFYLKRFFEFRPSLKEKKREREREGFVMDNNWKDSRSKRGRRDGLDSVCASKSRNRVVILNCSINGSLSFRISVSPSFHRHFTALFQGDRCAPKKFCSLPPFELSPSKIRVGDFNFSVPSISRGPGSQVENELDDFPV